MRKQQGYILRYYLPVKPNFDEEYTNKRFEELLQFCINAKVDAVMFFVALHPDCYYMPETPEYAESWRDQMLPYIKRLREAGVGYQLNFQNLLGANTQGSDFSNLYNWENLVDHKGREAKGAGCPIGEEFRRQSEKKLKIWAETKPDVIWLDDDFRMHNHGTPNDAIIEGESFYLDFYCFCDKHIKLFNERVGGNYTRETIVDEILRPGEPTKIRKEFMDFLSDTMTESAEWIEKTVHSVSPDTRLALMTSMPDIHAAEGRKWNEFLTALSGEFAPILRPTFGPYREQDQPPRDFISSYSRLNQLTEHLREAGLKNVELCPEVENTQFTVWAKSTASSSYQLSLSAFMGCKDITLSLYDLDGGAFFEEPAYEEMLKVQKPFLDTVLSLELSEAEELGIAIPTTGCSGKGYIANKGDDYESIGGKGRYIENYFLKMGVPCKFVSPSNFDKAEVFALDEYSARFLSNADLKKILSSSVFLDGGAADVLCKRGFAEYIGVKNIKGKRNEYVQAEVFPELRRQDGTYIRMPLRVPVGGFWYDIHAVDDAKVMSEFRVPTGEGFTGLTYFENSLGGKVVIYPAYREWGTGFYNHTRVSIIKGLLAELSSDMVTVECNSYTLAVVKEKENGERYYFLANLSASPTKEFKINGKTIEVELGIYQTAVYKESDGEITFIGKTLVCH